MCTNQREHNSLKCVFIFLLLLVVAILPCACGGGSTSGTTPPPQSNPVPSITSVSPNSVTTIAGGSVITITGTNFLSSSSVTWNGTSHASTYVSGTQLQLTLAASDVAAVGSAQIAVANPAPGGGTSSTSTISIVYPVPVINSLSPTSVLVSNAPVQLTINGAGFASSSVVQLSGVAHATTYVSSSTLTIMLSASDLANTTSIPITVVTGTPGGGTSAPTALTVTQYSTPTIAGVNPTSITVGSPDTVISVQGTEFTSSTTVQVNGTSLNPSNWSPNTLTFTLPAADLAAVGTVSITASNPGPLTSNVVTISVVPNPMPALSGLSPSSAALGGPDFTLTVSGSNFVPSSVVQWNGSARPTTFVNSNQLSATISAKDIAALVSDSVTVSSPAPGGGVTSGISFGTYIGLPAKALVYSTSTQLLYAAVPSSGGPVYGNSIVPIDPNTGVLGQPIFVGSEPNKVALSSDGNSMWVGIDGAAAVRKVDLINKVAGLQFNLGGGTGVYNAPSTAQSLAVMPGQSNTVAVATPIFGIYQSAVTIYDNGVARPNVQSGIGSCCSQTGGMVFDSTGTILYEAGSGYGKAAVSSTGITSFTDLNATVNSSDLRIDSGRAYLTSGTVLDANAGTQLGVFSIGTNQNASGPVAPDSGVGAAFVATASSSFGSNFEINSYDLSTFVMKGSLPLTGIDGSPNLLTRWGQDGLAFSTADQIHILHTTLVRDLSTSLADLSVTATSAPSTGTTGTNLTYTLKVASAGPLAATPATFTDSIPDGVTLQSVTPSQGSCSGAAVVVCDLGTLNSGSSATVQITITPLAAGTLTNTASVSAPQGDPNTGNNTVVSTTTVTGSTYNPVPMLTSISPAFVQTGSGSFVLTVNGSGFTSASTIQLNSTALATSFVNASTLSTTVPAADVATLGWAWITVVNPALGGGTSASLPLTTYMVVSLDVNRMIFDPFTRQLFASVPSTATQVAGNSLVAINPTSGALGTPLDVGSEPHRLGESSDGKYLYIGLDGSKSLTRVDLTSMTQGPVYPLTLPGSAPQTPYAARDLEVVPGNDNLLAIDPGFPGIGIVDISGSTATMRPTQGGGYTGTNIAFANPTTLYTYDTDTSGAEFYRWTVTSTGVSLNNNTGYTLDGIGGFAGGFELVDGLVYGLGGGVSDPTTTPPKQLGQCEIYSAQGFGQSIEGSGVAADPAVNRIFFLGETLAGTANPVLLSCDSTRYVLLGMEQFTGAAQGQDLVRWGRDGLAWHTILGGPFGNSTAGSGQIFLMRGPFVLPEWTMVNPVPTFTSASPSSVTAGSGNLTLTITGSNFVPGAVLTWNGAERTTTFVDSSHLTVAIPASDVSHAATATLAINNPGSGASGSISFTIN